jgi:hypothetical protein
LCCCFSYGFRETENGIRVIAYRKNINTGTNKRMEALLDVALALPPAPVAAPAAVAAVAAVAPPAAVVAAAVPFMAAIAAAGAPVMAAIVPGEDESIGCKLDVWRGTATRTKGGLMRQHLKLNRVGTVVSIKASDAAKRKNNLGNFRFPINP